MSKSVEAKLNPALLTWARETAGLSLDEAARKIGINTEKLEDCERGQRYLTFPQLRTAAGAYKRSLAAFLLPVPPASDPPLSDFRSVNNKRKEDYSGKLLIEIRRAKKRRRDTLELFQLLNREVRSLNLFFTLDADISESAAKVRGWLGVDIETQLAWAGKYTALNNWIGVFEKKDILVFQTSKVDKEEMIGLCVSEDFLPFILLNGKYTPNSKVFTLMHEFVHLVLRKGGVSSDFFDEGFLTDSDHSDIENFCNKVASEILVPSDDLANRFLEGNQTYDNSHISAIASQYCVSSEVILRKMFDMGKIRENTFFAILSDIRNGYRQTAEANKSKKAIVPHYRLIVRDNGKLFSGAVVESLDRGLISASDIGDYLNTNINHYSDIKNASHTKWMDTE
ncbi:ImmA/IrrE family metallo-endopeptidase [Deinococcus psychrotolerans]|uniref:ImmA/IrrE family metallo-endopeptidase n=1 Tax=Deinococcus psychrotolerans TaxID=2489213 RepID=A0A3G8YGC8_9DEIO|nr:XRE family transcriptional regulator [Deinococcus psychrotolerans]AZI43247.1 ImmA/IrrE family metallo-endopeptidase [Deinococcus psychrotolerans]